MRKSIVLAGLMIILLGTIGLVYLALQKDSLDIRKDASSEFDPNTYRGMARFGAGMAADIFPLVEQMHEWEDYKFGWYHNWREWPGFSYSGEVPDIVNPTATIPQNVDFYSMIAPGWQWAGPLEAGCNQKKKENISKLKDGEVMWVGNEIGWDDGRDPRTYAVHFRSWYECIKSVNPNIKVAPGANPGDAYFFTYSDQVKASWAIQDTRWQQGTEINFINYLTFAMDDYKRLYGEEMPIDAFVIHEYIQHQYNGDDTELYLNKLETSVREFRKFMKNRGHRNKELIIKEMGTLTSVSDQRWQVFKQRMTGTFDLLLSLKNNSYGNPFDNNRLVQRWSWFVGVNASAQTCFDASCNWVNTSLVWCSGVEGHYETDCTILDQRATAPLGQRYLTYVESIWPSYDSTPPAKPTLSYTVQEGGNLQVQISANDQQSKINSVSISVGKKAGKADVFSWKEIGPKDSYSLIYNTNYEGKYLNIKARDDGYNWSEIASVKIKSKCSEADIWDTKSSSPHGPDGKVNAGDLTKVLSKWGSSDLTADIWDKKPNSPHRPDGVVDAGDLTRVLYCWDR